MMQTPVISIRSARKSYGTFRLGPVDFAFEPGYVVGIVGPNGSGKTTLFRMLMNLTKPESGEVVLFGARYPESEVAIRQRIGYMPEAPVGFEEMSVAAIGSFVAYWYPSWNQQRFEDLLAESGIASDMVFRELSKGLQRRFSFALARSTEADLLLLDEPTAGVDPFARRAMMDEISRFMQEGERTVLMATHVMEEVRRLCDYIMLVRDGDFIGIYEKDSLLETWRSLWVDRMPDGPVLGVVAVEQGTPVRLVSNSPGETRDALDDLGIEIVRSGSIDLEEILGYLMRDRVTS